MMQQSAAKNERASPDKDAPWKMPTKPAKHCELDKKSPLALR